MTIKQKALIRKLIHLKHNQDKKINKENKVNNYLSKYGLKTDGYTCPQCEYHCLLYILKDESKNNYESLPKKIKEMFNDDSAFHCLNCHWEGLITEM